MAVSLPDWLKQREGELRLSRDGRSCSVYFAGQLQYVLIPVPTKGQYSCRITETINGRRLDSARTFPSVEQTLQGGLEDLRGKLGW
ncbi:MAG: hypothetical protein U0840_08905 [Gemmataceae bacterium]